MSTHISQNKGTWIIRRDILATLATVRSSALLLCVELITCFHDTLFWQWTHLELVTALESNKK